MSSFEQIELYMEATHQLIHDKEPDWDTTITFALTERDLLMVALSLTGIQFMYPCLAETSGALQKRMLEVIRAQQPQWALPEDDGEEGS